MSKVYVTKELAETIRSIRIENKIKSNALSHHIGKSPAYISKLEAGEINTLDFDVLNSILQYITKENEVSEDLINKLYDSLEFKYTQEEIREQLWFINYDTVICKIPVPSYLINSINQLLEEHDITRDYLLTRINSNESLPEEERNDSKLPFNTWYHTNNPSGFSSSIKISMKKEKLDMLLDKETDMAPFFVMQAIMFYLYKIIEFRDQVYISQEDYKRIYNTSEEYLTSNGFMPFSEKKRRSRIAKSDSELESLMNPYDAELNNLITDIVNGFRFASEHNIKITNKRLESFSKNLHWDIGFMLKMISFNFSDLVDIKTENRRQLLEEIEKLVDKYANLSASENIEMY